MTDEEFEKFVADLVLIGEAIIYHIMSAKTAASQISRTEHLDAVADLANRLSRLRDDSSRKSLEGPECA